MAGAVGEAGTLGRTAGSPVAGTGVREAAGDGVDRGVTASAAGSMVELDAVVTAAAGAGVVEGAVGAGLPEEQESKSAQRISRQRIGGFIITPWGHGDQSLVDMKANGGGGGGQRPRKDHLAARSGDDDVVETFQRVRVPTEGLTGGTNGLIFDGANQLAGTQREGLELEGQPDRVVVPGFAAHLKAAASLRVHGRLALCFAGHLLGEPQSGSAGALVTIFIRFGDSLGIEEEINLVVDTRVGFHVMRVPIQAGLESKRHNLEFDLLYGK